MDAAIKRQLEALTRQTFIATDPPPPGEKAQFCGQEGLRAYVSANIQGHMLRGVAFAAIVGNETVVGMYFVQTDSKDVAFLKDGEAGLLTLRKKL